MEYNTKREQFIKELRVDQNTLDNLARVPANARHAQSSSSESGTKGQLEREQHSLRKILVLSKAIH